MKKAIQGIPGEFWVFGSRADETAKGGDIDLLVFADGDRNAIAWEIQRRFHRELESKLDVMVLHPRIRSESEEAFLSTLKRGTVPVSSMGKLVSEARTNLLAALQLYLASIQRCGPLVPTKSYTPEGLEPYDALSSRFERALEVALKFFRTVELHDFADEARVKRKSFG